MLKHLFITILIKIHISVDHSTTHRSSPQTKSHEEPHRILFDKPYILDIENENNADNVCKKLHAFYGELTLNTYKGSNFEFIDNIKRRYKKGIWGYKGHKLISSINLHNDYMKLLEVIDASLKHNPDLFGRYFAIFIMGNPECMSENILVNFIYLLIEKSQVQNLKTFLNEFFRHLDKSTKLTFMKSNIKNFLNCDHQFINTVTEHFNSNEQAVVNQFIILYEQVVNLKRARADKSISKHMPELMQNMIRTGGIYGLLHLITQAEFNVPNEESYVLFKVLYKAGLFCIVGTLNNLFTCFAQQTYTEYVSGLGLGGYKCVMETTDLDTLSDRIKANANKELDSLRDTRKYDVASQKEVVQNNNDSYIVDKADVIGYGTDTFKKDEESETWYDADDTTLYNSFDDKESF